MTACSIMQNHPDSLVQAEAICCLQKLHLFAPNVVNLNTLIPHLCKNLLSPHLILRQASVDCLRQLAHREAKDICELGRVIIENNEDVVKKMYISNRGLEGLFKVYNFYNLIHNHFRMLCSVVSKELELVHFQDLFNCVTNLDSLFNFFLIYLLSNKGMS